MGAALRAGNAANKKRQELSFLMYCFMRTPLRSSMESVRQTLHADLVRPAQP